MYKKPPFLKENDTVAIVAPAKKVDKNVLVPAVQILESWGLKVKQGKSLYNEENQFAGSDKQRLKDLQSALDDVKIKAIFCARGGYGTNRIIDQTDWKNFRKSPKWIVGYSDVTVLHSHLQHLGYQSIHGTMPLLFEKDDFESVISLKEALFGEELNYVVEGHPINRKGRVAAPVIGGNLTILHTLLATPSEADFKDKILFIEDVGEYLYHLDRMMIHLRRAGKLKGLAGLIVGSFSEMKDNDIPFGKSVEEIILESVKDYSFPVCFNFPAGHERLNLPLVFGRKADLWVSRKETLLSF